jgi:hypothetical protein
VVVKKILSLVLLLSLTGCATMRRHPALTGAVMGVSAGVAMAIVTRKHCDHYPPGKNGVGVNCPPPEHYPEK